MVEATDAKELIDEAIERAEAQRDAEESQEHNQERRFRDTVSLLVGAFAVSLAVIHMAAAGEVRESLIKSIGASDSFAYMQSKIVRETVLKTAALGSAPAADRTKWATEAANLRVFDKGGHAIDQLQAKGKALRKEGELAAKAGEGYETGETALQLAIVLLSIALVARSRPIVFGATALAVIGIAIGIATAFGVNMPWVA